MLYLVAAVVILYCLMSKPPGGGIRCLTSFSLLRGVDERQVHGWFDWGWGFAERNGWKSCSGVVEQVIVDEFRTVFRIYSDDREREPVNHPLERFNVTALR